MTGARGWIALLVAVALGLRLAFALGYWNGKPLTHDEVEYLSLARSLVRGNGFTYAADDPPEAKARRFGRAPGYPAFLALLRVDHPSDTVPARVKVVQSIVGTLGVWLMALIAWRCGGPRAAVAAAAVGAVYPTLVWMPAYALSETLYSTLALAAALALMESDHVRRGGSERRRALVVGALLVAVDVLVRSAMLVFVPLGALWLWQRRSLAAAVLFVAIVVACVSPWTVRNHRLYGRWIVVTSDGGVTFWTGNHPLARGEGDLAANPRLKEEDNKFRAARPGQTAEQLEPQYYRDALGWMRAHPGAWLVLEVRKAFYTVVPIGPSYWLHSARYAWTSILAYLMILPAAAVGAWRARGLPRRPAPLWLMAAAAVVSALVFFPQERFRIPVIDPALVVSAAMLAAQPAHERTRRLSDV